MEHPPQTTRVTRSPEQTLALGRRVGAAAQAGLVIALTGELGAGKTVLTKGIAAGLGVDPDRVTSPTFVLMVRHEGRIPLHHFDAYRLTSAAELLDIGAEEAFYGDGVCVIEWADRVMTALPPERLDASLTALAPDERQLTFRAHGSAAEALLNSIAQA